MYIFYIGWSSLCIVTVYCEIRNLNIAFVITATILENNYLMVKGFIIAISVYRSQLRLHRQSLR